MKQPQEIKHQEKLIRLLAALYPDIKIWLFGSRARGDNKDYSDIDIAIDIGRRLTRPELGQVYNIVEAVNIPEKVDVVDMHAIPPAMKENVLKEGIVWKTSGQHRPATYL